MCLTISRKPSVPFKSVRSCGLCSKLACEMTTLDPNDLERLTAKLSPDHIRRTPAFAALFQMTHGMSSHRCWREWQGSMVT